MTEKKNFVALTYDLFVGEGEEKELMEKATKENPLTFYTGMGMMLDKFEKEVAPLKVGDKWVRKSKKSVESGDILKYLRSLKNVVDKQKRSA